MSFLKWAGGGALGGTILGFIIGFVSWFVVLLAGAICLGLARMGDINDKDSDRLEIAGLVMLPVAACMILVFTCCGCLIGTLSGGFTGSMVDDD